MACDKVDLLDGKSVSCDGSLLASRCAQRSADPAFVDRLGGSALPAVRGSRKALGPAGTSLAGFPSRCEAHQAGPCPVRMPEAFNVVPRSTRRADTTIGSAAGGLPICADGKMPSVTSTIAAASCTNVVRSIDAHAAAGISSKPATSTSSGTRMPELLAQRVDRADGQQIVGAEQRLRLGRRREHARALRRNLPRIDSRRGRPCTGPMPSSVSLS